MRDIYTIKTISSPNDIEKANLFRVDNFQWNSKQTPKTEGRLGYIKGCGFVLRMVCFEKNPKAEYEKHLDPVYKDSTMEAFFSFIPKKDKAPSIESFYTNIEFNSNGAVYAGRGYGRENRKTYTMSQIDQLELKIIKEDDFWQADFLLNESLIKEIYKDEEYNLWANFYKIADYPTIEHYGSYKKIKSDFPNFHRPDCFAKMIII